MSYISQHICLIYTSLSFQKFGFRPYFNLLSFSFLSGGGSHLTLAYCLRPHQVPKLHGHFPQCLYNLYLLAALQRWILYQDLLKYLRLTFVITSNFFKTWKDLITSNFTTIANVFSVISFNTAVAFKTIFFHLNKWQKTVHLWKSVVFIAINERKYQPINISYDLQYMNNMQQPKMQATLLRCYFSTIYWCIHTQHCNLYTSQIYVLHRKGVKTL